VVLKTKPSQLWGRLNHWAYLVFTIGGWYITTGGDGENRQVLKAAEWWQLVPCRIYIEIDSDMQVLELRERRQAIGDGKEVG
jgi:hypothetical protein